MAAEIYGSLSAALKSGSDSLPDMPMTHETVATSTTATRSTYQALAAIRRSDGHATVVGNDAIMRWQQRLAREEGLYVEPASAGTFAAIEQFRASGVIARTDKVLALLTASGLEDPAATDAARHASRKESRSGIDCGDNQEAMQRPMSVNQSFAIESDVCTSDAATAAVNVDALLHTTSRGQSCADDLCVRSVR